MTEPVQSAADRITLRRNRPVLVVAGLLIALVALRYLDGVDLKLAAFFFDNSCRCFPASKLESLRFFDQLVRWAGRLAIPLLLLLMLLLWLWSSFSKRAAVRCRKALKALSFMVLLGIITPVLLIHEVLKTEVGRARPRNIEQFAGPAVFTPAWIRSDACSGDCSFTSGHVAFGAWLMGAWFLGGRRRWISLGLGTLLTMMIGLMRMAQGAHFLTDVLGSVLLVWLTAYLLSWIRHDRWSKPSRP
ncbi:MAG: phosphatase PAP2 family protein [Betaproteobacteria bacterium]|nr:phosphatase PAP2 family protein [Betaproteobacteria bacterium]NCV32245.1 phosphatase PAP2 family protein [Betaproteobacteria bacterium]NCV89238.1 phosphatase PAP2 family protein [Betaproteobacteria bacterium]NCX73770.1 phosphatase PAP2 family protein [Betaproteobacteria bacterium]NDA19907.1 phosphatase PAP2 family protein [Betaproteobacteria bacterium]